MISRYYLGITDYVVIALSLLISAAIGILFRYKDGRQTNMNEYLMTSKNMSKFPVILSIMVTMISANSMVATPVEIYKYGTQYVIKYFGVALGILFSSYIYLPVYFQCEVSTVYEYLEMRFGKLTRYTISAAYVVQMYLEMRFGKLTRYTISAAYVVQMVLYMSSVLYVAVLSLSAVTNLSFEMSVIFVGICCTFYCSIGGLKAVLWTDVFQCLLMFSCVITVCVAGIIDGGGIHNIFSIAKAGNRIEFFNFSLDLTKRYTFWNCLFRGFWLGVGYFGISQTEVQRILCMSSIERAKSVLRLSIAPVLIFQFLCDFMGLILYGRYHACDPLLNRNYTGLTKYDQLLPYYIVNRVGSIPGLTGLCVAGIFSGSLSTISSALNALATVTIMDFLKPVFPMCFRDKRSLLIAKFLTTLYGIFCICFALVLKGTESVKQVTTTLVGLMEGPMIAIFTIAVFTRKASDKCILLGFLVALPIIIWINFGSLIGKYSEPPLPVSMSNCSTETFNVTLSAFHGNTSVSTVNTFSNILILYKISFNWLPILGTLLTLSTTLLAIAITGWRRNVIPADSKCLSPILRNRKQNLSDKRTKEEKCSSEVILSTHAFLYGIASESTRANEKK